MADQPALSDPTAGRAWYSLLAENPNGNTARLKTDSNGNLLVAGGTGGGGSGDASAANQVITNTEIGALTETAPGTDTASSGINGRLQRVSQRLTSLIGLLPTSLGQKTKAGSLAVTLASDQDTLTITPAADSVGLTATRSTVADTASSATLLSSNTARKGATFINNSSSALYIKLGATADITTGCDIILPSLGFYELPQYNGQVYKGRLDGIWSADSTGSVNIVEYT